MNDVLNWEVLHEDSLLFALYIWYKCNKFSLLQAIKQFIVIMYAYNYVSNTTIENTCMASNEQRQAAFIWEYQTWTNELIINY